jgi:iron complex transport system permease protein
MSRSKLPEAAAPPDASSRRFSRHAWILAGTALALLALIAVSLALGRYSLPLSAWWHVLVSPEQSDAAEIVLLEVRLPRVIAAVVIGGGLSVSGAAFQGMFRNPMASPDMLGAYAGSGFGASLAILMGFGIVGIQAMGFIGGLAAVFLAWAISFGASRFGADANLTLILVGIVIREGCMALVRLTEYVADPRGKLAAITFWLVGGLSAVTPRDVEYAAAPIFLGVAVMLLLRWRINLLSFGDDEARALGVNPWRLRVVLIFCAAMISAAVVSIGGMIMWVGLVIPHLARMLVGADHKVLLPASFLVGAFYLLLVDDCARGLFTLEVPLGILTSIVGVPFFLYLLFRSRMMRA